MTGMSIKQGCVNISATETFDRCIIIIKEYKINWMEEETNQGANSKKPRS